MASIGEENGVGRIQNSSVHYSIQNPMIPQGKTRISDPSPGGSKANRLRNLQVTGYHECLKNHAASTGGNVTDGCGEFMPSGEEGTLEALKCAACSCHRNFHRRDNHGQRKTSALMHPLLLPPPLPSPSMIQHREGGVMTAHWTSMVQPVKVGFKGDGISVGTDSSSEELNFDTFMAKKKRQRTKFTAEQKDKMLGFAEKLGWRIPREDDTEVQQFCGEVGVRRHVFKVWMHNNKISSKKTAPEIVRSCS